MNTSIFKLRKLTRIVSREASSKIEGFYTESPIALFRIVTKANKITLREYSKQLAKGSHSFDYVLGENGLINPAPLDGFFIGPNGASLRPATINMWDILSHRSGETYVTEIPQGTKIPDGLILLHERDDHYSLQCSVAMKPTMLVSKINAFLGTCKSYTSQEYFKKNPLPTAHSRPK